MQTAVPFLLPCLRTSDTGCSNASLPPALPDSPAKHCVPHIDRRSESGRIEYGEKAGWLAPIPLEVKRQKVREKCLVGSWFKFGWMVLFAPVLFAPLFSHPFSALDS